MLNNPWETGSPKYRLFVVAGLIITGLGIVCSLIGINTGNDVLTWMALPLLGIGLACYVVSIFFRRPPRGK
ncbi:hypothetical protein [Arthrobacter castelli]|uniref:hypothetical protein n=1 Tax=Arthrobacter castelli TaxID=271431 RepID=UPI00041D826F|nr:hypothetical protein [Arthrobacter castelli]